MNPQNIVPKTDHESAPGWQICQLIGGGSAGQLIEAHIEQGDHTTPSGEKYHRLDGHRFAAEAMLVGIFGGGR